jgi:hypothetical protein
MRKYVHCLYRVYSEVYFKLVIVSHNISLNGRITGNEQVVKNQGWKQLWPKCGIISSSACKDWKEALKTCKDSRVLVEIHVQQSCLANEFQNMLTTINFMDYTGLPRFISQYVKVFSLLHPIQIGSGANQPPTQYTMSVLSLGLSWPSTHLHPVPRSRVVQLYIHYSIHLHGVLCN